MSISAVRCPTLRCFIELFEKDKVSFGPIILYRDTPTSIGRLVLYILLPFAPERMSERIHDKFISAW